MSSSPQPPAVSNVSMALARSRLGVPSIIFFTMGAAAPLLVVAGATTTAHAVTRITAIPVAFLAVAAVLAIFSVGYVAMARRITNAGAFYTYVSRGLGRTAGVAAAFIAVLAYNALQIALYGGFGVLASGLLAEKFHLDVAWWVCALAAWAVIAILGVLRVDLNGKVLAVLLTAEVLIVVVYDIFNLANPAGGSIDFSPLAPTGLFTAGIGAALVLAITGFCGFENAAIFSEEAKDPRRTVPTATFVTIAIVAALYSISSWAMSVATGVDNIVEVSHNESVFTLMGLAAQNINTTAADLGAILLVTSVFAAMLAFHNAVARYLFALGREGVLPKVIGRTSPRSGSPKVGSMVQSALAFATIVIYLALDLDPLVQLFFWVGMLGGFGVLLLVTFTSVAVTAYFVRDPGEENLFTRVVAPALAALLLGVVSVVAVINFDVLLGVKPTDNLRWILPALFAVVAAIGLTWGIVLRATRPDTYESIGLGANAATGRTFADIDEPAPVGAPTGGAA